jgi:rhamnogalacturonan acetylesterase
VSDLIPFLVPNLTQPRLAASQMGGPSAGVYYVPHGAYSAQAMKGLGADVVNANYPNDHTHTAPYLADALAKAFVLGLKCGTSDLGKRATNSTASLTQTYLGNCISANSTLPI